MQIQPHCFNLLIMLYYHFRSGFIVSQQLSTYVTLLTYHPPYQGIAGKKNDDLVTGKN